MLRRPLRRAVALSLGALLLLTGSAAADTILADNVTPVVNGSHFLGDTSPGGPVSADVSFVVACAGVQHIDHDQSVILTGAGGIAPLDGAIVSASTATLTPLTIPWGPDGEGCPDPVPSYAGGATSHVVLRAPTTAGTHTFTVQWTRELQPMGVNDGNAFSRSLPSINFSVRVVGNTPPVITVPASFSAEGDTSGGWNADWSSVSATDAEDDPDPIPSCTPAAGSRLLLGTTTHVTCTVTDTAGASDSDSFDVTVVDTTPPTLGALPADITVSTDDATGRTIQFATPSATDVVDPSPSVVCDPASGSHFDVRTTVVTCTATDGSGRQASGSFSVTVVYDPPPPPPPPDTASAIWLEPVAGSGSTFVANRGRTIPVKVRLFVDDRERTTGAASLRLIVCGATTGADLPLIWSGGRWNVPLDTSSYAAPCYTVAAWIDGLKAGSFTLQMRGDIAAKSALKRATVPEGSTVPITKTKPKKPR
ncbi:MAG TPA: HYR domain-containing protein [Candidatus Limnocylindrales bacterium]|nr:HYR domain-containing protein [Candidatus Limnocylindrales bacterium]